MRRDRFRGHIAGVGSSSGVRLVVGHWRESPLGVFTDVMVATRTGERVLLAPSTEVADYVGATYTFDRVEIGPVVLTGDGREWHVSAPALDLRLRLGTRPLLGRLLGLVPPRLAAAPSWTLLTDPVSRVVLRGVRTRGSAGGGRREFYGATDLRRIEAIEGTWEGRPLGVLGWVVPDPRFGFGSTPERPSVTAVVTTVQLPARHV